MDQPFKKQFFLDKGQRRLENAVPGMVRGKKSLGWTPTRKQRRIARELEVVSVTIAGICLFTAGLFLLDALGIIHFRGLLTVVRGLGFFALGSCGLLFGVADHLSGGNARLSGWTLVLLLPVAVASLMGSLFLQGP